MLRLPRDRCTLSLSPAHPPAIEIGQGEPLLVECPSAMGGVLDPSGRPSAASAKANPMAGPVRVKGVRPGDQIAVRIRSVEPVGFGKAQGVVYAPSGGRLAFLNGLSVPAEPSIGCIGVAPRLESDSTSNDACGPHGGNLDCRDAAPGAFVFFRAQIEGANLGFGDVHLAMGDGEIGGQGVEAAADAVVEVLAAAPAGVEWPFIVRGGWIMTLGGHADLKTAQRIAYEEMMSLARNLFRLERAEVQARIACAGWLKVCQACCPTITVRVCLPLGLFGETQESFLRKTLAKRGRGGEGASPARRRSRRRG